jgi:hypothetical protein
VNRQNLKAEEYYKGKGAIAGSAIYTAPRFNHGNPRAFPDEKLCWLTLLVINLQKNHSHALLVF